MNDPSIPSRHMDTLARLMVRTYGKCDRDVLPEDLDHLKCDLSYVARLDQNQRRDFLRIADANHVLVRALTVLENAATALTEDDIAGWCQQCLSGERARIERAVDQLQSICAAMQSEGCDVVVIKSLDHWPDLGSDLDLYTTSDPEQVARVLRDGFNAHPVERSWGDRLANKWNYRVPGLPELVEAHVKFLGQTGEHVEMAKRVVERRVLKTVGGHEFFVPAPEERIVISTLQRVYRHFYFRLCDMIDMALLIDIESISFAELERASDLAGVWPGVATFLCLIQDYIRSYGGELALPDQVIAAAHAHGKVRFGNGFLRVSKVTAAGLYSSQLLQAGRHGDLRALARLPLLPPLAISALVAQKITGNDKGIW